MVARLAGIVVGRLGASAVRREDVLQEEGGAMK
jgi:hypothetical protein